MEENKNKLDDASDSLPPTAAQTTPLDRPPTPLQSPKKPHHKRLWFALAVATVLLIIGVGTVGYLYLREQQHLNQATPESLNSQRSAEALTLQLIDTAKKLQQAEPAERVELTNELKKIAVDRKSVMMTLMRQDPKAFLALSEPTGFKDMVPAEVAKNTERKTQLQGTLEILHGEVLTKKPNTVTTDDGHDHSHDHSGEYGVTAEFEYYLEAPDGKKTRVYFDERADIKFANKRIKLNAVQIDEEAAALATDVTLQAGETASSTVQPAVMKKVAVILVNFESNKTQPWTADQVRTAVFTGPSSSNAWFKEVSFGKVGLTGIQRTDGDVFGYFTINYDTTTCSHSTIASLANTAATNAGVSLTGYTNISYVFPRISACAWGGLGQMNNSKTWINGYGTDSGLFSHEFGHNFGAYHAASYSCTLNGARVTISDTCTHSEYGDPYDTMGSSWGRRHFNSSFKGRLQYYPSSANTVTATSGTYKITPLAQASAGVQALRIPKDFDVNGVATSFYYVDFRQPFGFDNYSTTSNVVAGASIRIGVDYTKVGYTYLLDMTPATTTFSDSALLPGKEFFDEKRNIRIAVDAVDPTGVTVRVNGSSTPTCVRAMPSISIDPTSQWTDPGASLTYKLTVKNNDSAVCAASTFNLSSEVPSGLTQNPGSSQVSLSPGASSTVAFTMTAASTLTSGSYGFTEVITHGADSTLKASAAGSLNIYERSTVPPVVTITSPANGSTVNGRFEVAASATGQAAISKMEVYIDGAKKAESFGNSISYNMNVKKYKKPVSINITVRAYDANGTNGGSIVTVKTP